MRLDNLTTNESSALLKPIELMAEYPITSDMQHFIQQSRLDISQILMGMDNRLLVIVGPCSIHDTKAALEYGLLLSKAAQKFQKNLLIVMRTYFEKPRTLLGWKGLISDPNLDGSFDMNHGLRQSRHLLSQLANLKLPTATEFLDTFTPQYIADLISWCAVGARTVESQIHRELASSFTMPLGFKNTTYGNIQIAVDAIRVARHSHHLVSISPQGAPIIFKTHGNPNCHLILRGSKNDINYAKEDIKKAAEMLLEWDLIPRIMIDCSHGNCLKDAQQQSKVVHSICDYMLQGQNEIFGVMLESNLVGGKQELLSNQSLVYGQSITDPCLSWNETLPILEKLSHTVEKKRKQYAPL
jgi:3-deoxy-7-phosphoheptulonate synthase